MDNFFVNPQPFEWQHILKRPVFDTRQLEDKVSGILNDVKQNGDAAVKKYALQFDKAELASLKVSEEEFAAAMPLVDEALKAAIGIAKENISRFHAAQKENVTAVETAPGVNCWRKSVAIDKVGLYIPGGTAPLFSTLLMLGIPAVIAGCREIVLCTPSGADGKVNPVVLYTAQLLGLTNVYKIGGVQNATPGDIISPDPEPSTWLLATLAALGVVATRRRWRR